MSVLPVQAFYRLTEKDAHEAQLKHCGWERQAQQIVAIPAVTGAVLLWWSHQYPLALLALLLAFVLFFRTWLSGRAHPAKHLTLSGEMSFAATEEDVAFASISSALNVKWRSIQHTKESKNLVLFYLQPRLFYIVPKRALSLEDLTNLRFLLERHVGERSRWIAGASQMKLAVIVIAVALAVVLVFFAVHANR